MVQTDPHPRSLIFLVSTVSLLIFTYFCFTLCIFQVFALLFCSYQMLISFQPGTPGCVLFVFLSSSFFSLISLHMGFIWVFFFLQKVLKAGRKMSSQVAAEVTEGRDQFSHLVLFVCLHEETFSFFVCVIRQYKISKLVCSYCCLQIQLQSSFTA